MRVSRAQAEENRETVINVASRLFREHGFDGIGLKDLMKGAGLTQGGFYKQFASKDDLAAQASRRAMESATRRWSEAAADSSDPLEAVMAFYLSRDHRGEKAEGCPLVALGSDATRQSEEVRRPFEDGIRAHFEVLNELLDDTRSLQSERQGDGDPVSHGRRRYPVADHGRREYVSRNPRRSGGGNQAHRRR